LARRDRKGSLNDGRIQNPSNPFGIVPLSNFVPRGFGFVHHSRAILYHEVPNPNLTIRNFFHRSTPVAAGGELTHTGAVGWVRAARSRSRIDEEADGKRRSSGARFARTRTNASCG
jgi:hypothetical protein